MNDNIKEKISSLIDGELSEFEARRLIEEIESNPEFRKYWSSLQITSQGLKDKSLAFISKDLSARIAKELNQVSPEENRGEKVQRIKFVPFISTAALGVLLVLSLNTLIKNDSSFIDESFSDQASKKIAKAIESPEALNLLNHIASGLDVKLEKLDSNSRGQINANYRIPSNGKTFNVSLSPISSSHNMRPYRSSKITYLKSKKGRVFVLVVSGDISSENKTQILRSANLSFNRIE